PAASAGDIKGHGAEVAHFDELHVTAGLDDFAGDLVAEDESLRRSGAASDHVLIATADIGGNNFQNDAMLAFPRAKRECRIVDRLDFYCSRSDIGDPAISCPTAVSFLV